MKYLLNLFVFCSVLSSSGNGFAMPEIPFCPGGGPPGWLNHFNYKRDQNIWRQQNAYGNSYQHRFSNTPAWSAPGYQRQASIFRQYPSQHRRQYYQAPRLQDEPRNR